MNRQSRSCGGGDILTRVLNSRVPTLPDGVLSIPAAFEERVREQPDSVAVQDGPRTLTYRELDRMSHAVAVALAGLGIEREARVGVMAERGAGTVIAALGTMRAGGAYVPVDPDSPPRRLGTMLAHASARAVLSPAHLAHRLAGTGASVMLIEDVLGAAADPDARELVHRPRPEDLFAVLFTSGTTGMPKGVALEHRNLLNLLSGAPGLTPERGEGALHVCAPQFDIAAFEIWATLLSGGRLVCHAPGRPDPRQLAAQIARDQVTWSALPTSLFHQMAEFDPRALAGLRTLILGGEVLQPRYARRVRDACPRTRIINAYAPAEASVFVAAHEIDDSVHTDPAVPIGRPIARADLRILDGDGAAVRAGEVGELYIGGPGVCRGYLNAPEQTASRFLTAKDGVRLYRSGDLVRRRGDGALEILGRTDDQLKLSGYRVEPAEIEAALSEIDGVARSAVITHEDAPGSMRLVAYVEAQIDRGELQRALAERLPTYLLPASTVVLDELPVNANGKVDRAALRAHAPAPAQGRGDAGDAREASLLEIFREVLGVDTLGVQEDFFEHGGNSLLAVQALVRVRERLGIELPLAALFGSRSAKALAALIPGAPAMTGPPPLIARPHRRPVPASASQATALMLTELADESLPYQSQCLHRIIGELDVAALERSLSALVSRHEILRTTFSRERGRWYQHVHPAWEVRLAAEDLRAHPGPQAALQQSFGRLIAGRLDPSTLPLVHWALARTADDEHALMSVEHHVVHDGVSTAIVLGELAELYSAAVDGRDPRLRRAPVQYRDFVAWQEELLSGDRAGRSLEHWTKRLRDAPRELELPRDRPRPMRQTFRGRTLHQRLAPELAHSIRSRAREWEASAFTVMLAAYAELLGGLAGSDELVIGSGLANRRTLGSEQVVGMLVNTVALRMNLAGHPEPRELVGRVQDVVLEAHDHQDVPFEHVVRRLAPARSASAAPLYQALFSFHDAPVRTLELPGATLIPGDARANGSAKADLSVIVINRAGTAPAAVERARYERVAEDGLTILWEYNSDLFDAGTAEGMLADYLALLGASSPTASVIPAPAAEMRGSAARGCPTSATGRSPRSSGPAPRSSRTPSR